jgi:hypothetical protein
MCGVVALLAAPRVARSQATIPGAPNIEPTRIRYGTFEYTLIVLRDGEEQIVGSLTDEILPIRGDAVINRVQTTKRSGGPFIDSTVTDAETLGPRWHHGVQPKRSVLLEFTGTKVSGTISAPNTKDKAVNVTLPDAAFDASNWDLAIRALPLDDGDAAVIQVYDVDQQLHRYNVRVAERDMRGKSYVIHVIVQLGRNNEAHVWFDDVTRTLLRIETPIGPGVLLRQILKP